MSVRDKKKKDKGDGIASIASTTIGEMEPPTDVAQRNIDDAEDIASEPTPIIRDSSGTIFDSRLHATDSEGNPVTSKAGNFRKRRMPSVPTPQISVERKNAVEAGRGIAEVVEALGRGIFGDEWKCIKDKERDEKQQMSDAFAYYLEKTGRTDFPPTFAVCLALLSYSLPRFFMPVTRKKVKVIGAWFSKKFSSIKFLRKRNNASQSDRWHDGQR